MSSTHVTSRLLAVVVMVWLAWFVSGDPASASGRPRPPTCDTRCEVTHELATTQSAVTGWSFATFVTATGGSCDTEYGLRVCRTGLPIYGGDEGTTYGTTLVANENLHLTPHLARHETAHTEQWARYGWSMPWRYGWEALLHGVRCDNRFEQEAGLKDGDYAECPGGAPRAAAH